jgi:predicted HD phosphohydrolase
MAELAKIHTIEDCLAHPYVTRLQGIDERNSWHNETTYEHTLNVYNYAKSQNESDSFLIAALLHDVGKYETRKQLPCGNTSFPNHELVGYNFVKPILGEGVTDREMILTLVRDHGLVHEHLLSGQIPGLTEYKDDLRRFCLYEVLTSQLRVTKPEEYLARKLLLEATSSSQYGIQIQSPFD